MKKKRLILFFFITIIFFALIIHIFIKKQFSLLSYDNNQIIKKYLFPFELIKKQEKLILENNPIHREVEYKNKNKKIKILRDFELSNNYTLKYLPLMNGFYSGIHSKHTSSGYLDFYKDKFFILSSRGTLAYSENINNSNHLKLIKNNINDFIGIEHFSKNVWFSIKDLLIHKDKIFISYTEEIEEYCWNTSVIYGEINYENIVFKKFFSPKECIHTKNNLDKEFNAHQSGGRLVSLDDENILLSIGDYRSRFLAQDTKSVNGKLIKINIDNFNYEIISIGHRNPQGLFFDKENNILLETEHGPKGGDEINLIPLEQVKSSKILNYGWAIVSAGEHYVVTEEKINKYPLYKSHEKYGFIEPLKSFVPSIGISEITKIGPKKYVVGSMRDKSIYFFELNENKKIINLERVEVYERVRDLTFHKNILYLFLENSSSIGLIEIK
jgi:hypothetical protein